MPCSQKQEEQDFYLLSFPYTPVCVCAHSVAQSCLTLCDSMDCGPLGSSVPGIFQARILEWGAISYSRGSSPPRDWTQVSCIAGGWFTIWATRKRIRLPDAGWIPELGRFPWKKWHPTPVFLPGKFHRQRSLVGDSPWGCKESDTTEQVAQIKWMGFPFTNETLNNQHRISTDNFTEKEAEALFPPEALILK